MGASDKQMEKENNKWRRQYPQRGLYFVLTNQKMSTLQSIFIVKTESKKLKLKRSRGKE